MTFLHPALFAAGLAAVALPILIHLLTRRRRKVVRWGAMRFLLEAYRKQRRRLRLEQWLLLAARCLLVGLIGFALARPMFGAAAEGMTGARTVVLAIDNGLAASAVDEGGATALERHKAAVRAVLTGLDAMAGDRAGLVTLGGPAAGVVMPPSADLVSVGRLIEDLEATDSATDVAGLGPMLTGLDAEEATVVLLSDWRGGSVRRERALRESGSAVRLALTEPATNGLTNVGVSGLEPPRALLVRSALGPADLASAARVALVRSGEGVSAAGVTRVTAWLDPVRGGDPVEVGSAVVRWGAGQTEATATIAVGLESVSGSEAFGVLRVSIDADAVGGDNVRRAPIELRDRLRVAVVAPGRFGREVGVDRFGAADWVRLALAPTEGGDNGLELVELDPGALDRARVLGLDAAVILRPDLVRADGWAVLRSLADKGGLVLVTPAADESLQAWTEAFGDAFGVGWTLGREAAELSAGPALAEPVSGGSSLLSVLGGELAFLVEAVHVSRVLPVEGAAEDEVLLRASTGEPMLVVSRVGEGPGLAAVLTSALDVAWTDLPVKPLMVPLMQELVRQGVAAGSRGVRMDAGGVYQGGGEVAELAGEGSPVRVGEGVALRRAGVWRALSASGSPMGVVTVNAETAGGDVSVRTAEQVAEWLGGMGAGSVDVVAVDEIAAALTGGVEGAEPRGGGISWMVLAGACGLAVVEMFLARLVSHAGLAARGGQ